MAGGSKFVSHLKIWGVIVPIVMCLIVPLFADDSFTRLSDEEIESNKSLLGMEAYDSLQVKIDGRFSNWFIKSGWYKNTLEYATPRRVNGNESGVSAVMRDYFGNFWKMVYRAVYRLHVGWHWLLGGSFIILGAMYDGWQRRNIKSFEFGYSSPLKFHLVTHGFLLVTGLGLLLCFLPLTVTSWYWAAGIGLLVVLGWKMMESYQVA